MSSAEGKDQRSAAIGKKAKMSGDGSALHSDGIPPDALSKVRDTGGIYGRKSSLMYARFFPILQQRCKVLFF